MTIPNDKYSRVANLRWRAMVALEPTGISYIPPVDIIKWFDENNSETHSIKNVKYELIKINLNAPLRIILGEIIAGISLMQKVKKNAKKFNIDTLERDVGICELHLSHGKKIREIAQEIYPDHFQEDSEKDEDTAIREVKRSLARIKKLIKDGVI